jgi:hypothetical protein
VRTARARLPAPGVPKLRALAARGVFVQAPRVELELLREELPSMSDSFGDEVFVHGVPYMLHEPGTDTYHSLCGPLQVRRSSYRRTGVHNGPIVIALELAAGLVEGATPALAYGVAHGYAQSQKCRSNVLRSRVSLFGKLHEVAMGRIGFHMNHRRVSDWIERARTFAVETRRLSNDGVHPFHDRLVRVAVPGLNGSVVNNPRRDVPTRALDPRSRQTTNHAEHKERTTYHKPHDSHSSEQQAEEPEFGKRVCDVVLGIVWIVEDPNLVSDMAALAPHRHCGANRPMILRSELDNRSRALGASLHCHDGSGGNRPRAGKSPSRNGDRQACH